MDMLSFLFIFISLTCSSFGLLYIQESETRELKDLSGLWNFVPEEANTHGLGFRKQYWKTKLSNLKGHTVIPVPCAFNDITESQSLRDHVGWVWYQTQFYVPKSWKDHKIVLRFGSVNYFASVYANSNHVTNHSGGHVPFQVDISDDVNYDTVNVLTVAVNNTLDHSTIPPGEFKYYNETKGARYHLRYPDGFFKQEVDFDFFPYSGILRPVHLWKVPNQHIDDITVTTGFVNNTGVLKINVSLSVPLDNGQALQVKVLDKNNIHVLSMTSDNKDMVGHITNVNKWWPRKMHRNPAYLYNLQVSLINKLDKSLIDTYHLPIGFRTVRVEGNRFLINDLPFYFHGTDMHEDSDIRGRGFDRAVLIKDLNLLEWLDGNAFRTSHYPYAEERYYEADRRGIVIIGETPAVGVRYFNSANLKLHQRLLQDMISRDKNHPSVVMWSMANEPHTALVSSRAYFKQLIDDSHSLDPTRPVTIVLAEGTDVEQTADLLDVVCLNRYFGWYINMGYTSLITQQVYDEYSHYYEKWKKPMIVSEYGAGSLSGINTEPAVGFSEAYQTQLMVLSHVAFDKMRRTFLIGELVWNLADFMTTQGITRVVGNRKGLFTRNRQPKMAAYAIKHRYEKIGRYKTKLQSSQMNVPDFSAIFRNL